MSQYCGLPNRSCVELLKIAGEAVDALFAMDLPVPLGVVRSLGQGIDATLQRCAACAACCVDCRHSP